MLFQNLISSPALSITQFSDIDAFRPVEFVADARSVPLSLVNFHTARAAVQLPSCQITALTSFARIVDVSYRVAHGLVIFQLEDNYEVSANGMSVNGPAFIGMRGKVDCKFVEPRGVIVDSKSGVSGAGRTPKLTTHFPECNESVAAYNVGQHRHTPEIEQALSDVAGELDAARDAGLMTAALARTGNAPLPRDLAHPVLHALDEIA